MEKLCRRIAILVILCILSHSAHANDSQPDACRPFLLRKPTITRTTTTATIVMERPRLCNPAAQNIVSDWINATQQAFLARIAPNNAASTPGNSIEGTVTFSSSQGHYLSAAYTVSEHMGGAHPNNTVSTFILDMRTGRRLRLADLFTNLDAALAALSDAVQPKIGDLLGHAPSPMARGRLLPVEQNYAECCLAADGLAFFFPAYQLDGRGSGNQMILVPTSAVRQWLKPDIAHALDRGTRP